MDDRAVKLYLKQRVFSWRDRFGAVNARGEERYNAEGEIFSWGKKLHIYDANGREAAFIRQKLFSFLPRYFVEINQRVVCEIVKDFTLFRQSYHIEGLGWRVEGDFWAHEYALYDQRGAVMTMTKAWFSWGDSYELTIADPADELLCLCVALAIDCAVAQSKDQ